MTLYRTGAPLVPWACLFLFCAIPETSASVGSLEVKIHAASVASFLEHPGPNSVGGRFVPQGGRVFVLVDLEVRVPFGRTARMLDSLSKRGLRLLDGKKEVSPLGWIRDTGEIVWAPPGMLLYPGRRLRLRVVFLTSRSDELRLAFGPELTLDLPSWSSEIAGPSLAMKVLSASWVKAGLTAVDSGAEGLSLQLRPLEGQAFLSLRIQVELLPGSRDASFRFANLDFVVQGPAGRYPALGSLDGERIETRSVGVDLSRGPEASTKAELEAVFSVPISSKELSLRLGQEATAFRPPAETKDKEPPE